MITDYDIQRISSAIVDKLVNDERFIRRMAKVMPKQERMLGTHQVSKILNLSRKTVCKIASQLGGMKGEGLNAKWIFPEQGLVERYKQYKLNGGGQ